MSAQLKAMRKDTQQTSEALRKDTQQTSEALRKDMNTRFEELRQDTQQTTEALRQDTNTRFEELRKDTNNRFKDLTHHLNNNHNTTLVMFSTIITLMTILFGYIIWDRRTLTKPFHDRLTKVEKTQQKHSDYWDKLMQALRKMAQQDPNLASILRSVSLM